MKYEFRAWHKYEIERQKNQPRKFVMREIDKHLFFVCESDDSIKYPFDEVAINNDWIFELYIGAKDKHDVKIFEGDIVLTNEGNWIASVEYYQDMAICVDEFGGFSSYCDWNEFEVIGNIHQGKLK